MIEAANSDGKIDNIEIEFKDLKIKKRENYNVIIGNFNIIDLKKNYQRWQIMEFFKKVNYHEI